MPIDFKKNLKFSPKPEVRLDEFNFDGGLITDVHETKLQSNQSPNMENVVFNASGSIKSRNGYVKYNSSSIGSTPITGLIRFYGSAGIKQTIAKYGTSLYRGNDIAGTFTAITLGSGVSLDTSFVDYTISNGTLLVVDGSNYIQKYRGSTNSNYTTGTIAVTEDSAAIVGSGTSWATSTNAEIGEYIKLPDNKWYKITAIADNTHLTVETTYQATTASGQSYTISPWGEVQGKLDTDTANTALVRPQPTYIENHINRIWTLEDNMLRFSALDTSISGEHFNDWDTGNNAGAINLPSGKETTTTGLYSFNGALYVFQRRAIWRVQGTAPANFELKNVSNEIGMTDRRTLVEWNGLLIFLSDQGVIVFDGTNIRNITQYKINTLINSWADKTSPAAVLWDNKYLLSYTPAGDTSNSEAIFCDLAQGDVGSSIGLSVGTRWGKFTNIPANIFSAWSGSSDNGEIYFGSSAAGYVYHWDTGTDDAGTGITTLYDTPSLGFGANVNSKTLKKFFLQQLQTGAWTMTCRMYSDISANTESTTIDLSPGTLSLWGPTGSFEWGDNWSSEGEILTTRVAEFQGLAQYFKFRFEASNPIEVLGITVTERQKRL